MHYILHNPRITFHSSKLARISLLQQSKLKNIFS